MHKVFLILCLGLLGAGCRTPDEKILPATINQVEVGMARADVIKLIGNPTKSEHGPDQRSLDIYLFGGVIPRRQRHPLVTDHWITRSLSVIYGADQKVERKYEYVGSIPTTRLPNGNVLAGREDASKRFSQIQTSVTTRADLRNWFGNPNTITLDLSGEMRLTWFFFEFNLAGELPGYELVATFGKNDTVADFRINERK